MIEPSVNGAESASSTSSVRIGELLGQFSAIWDFLTARAYKSGKKRMTGRLSLSLAAEGLKVTLTDDTTGTYCVRVAESLDEALLALETGLADGSLKWLKSDPKYLRK